MRSPAGPSPWKLGLIAGVLITNPLNPQAAADDPLRRVINETIRLARQHKDVPPAAEPPPGALNILRAFYGDETTPWLPKATTADLIDALPWTLRIPVGRERLNEIAGLGAQPGTRAFERLPEVQLAEALLVELTVERSLTLEEFHAVARRVVGTWAAGDPPYVFEHAGDYFNNAIVDEREQVRLPNGYTGSSYHRRRAPDEPTLALTALGPRAADLIPDLVLAVDRKALPFDALTMLALAASRHPSQVEALVNMLGKSSHGDIATIIEVHLGGAAIESVQALLSDPDAEVREQAADLLYTLSASADVDPRVLLAALRDENEDVVWPALNALAARPPSPSVILAHIDALLRAGEMDLTSWSNGKETTPRLLVGQILATAKPAVIWHLEDALRSATLESKWSAADAVRRILGDDLAVVVFVKVLFDGDPDARMVAIGSLGRIGPNAKLAVPILTSVFWTAESNERHQIRVVLRLINPL